MHAISILHASRQLDPVPAPARLVALPGRPSLLHVRALGQDEQVILVSFSLGPLRVLSPCELEVARWANGGLSNPAIAALRRKSAHTVARHMASVLAKLRIGSRLALATIPELDVGTPGLPHVRSNGDFYGDCLFAHGVQLEPHDVARIWREIAAGQWCELACVDIGTTAYVKMRRFSSRSVDWSSLCSRERDVLDFVSSGVAQKVIAMKLALAPSTVSAALRSACFRLEFASFGQLVRAYFAARIGLF